MIEHVKKILIGQFEASLCMLNECIQKCPNDYWDGPAPTHTIAKYSFWLVAYHTLCFADLYLSPSEDSYQLRSDFHPQGWSEFNDEYPSRRFEKHELAAYVVICRQKARETLAAETRESLERDSGFPRLPFSRGELHLSNLRHIQHHTGQLSAFLRRIDQPQDTKWVKTGWR